MWQPTVSSDELYHHGILHQKWGVRNGPPYPLNQSQRSKAEKTAKSSTYANSNKKDESRNKGLTEDQKKLIAKGAVVTAALLATMGTMYVTKKSGLNPLHVATFSFGKSVDLSALSNKVLTIGKDTKLQRISSKQFEDYVNEGKSIYASYLKKDKAIYKEQMPKFIKDWEKRGIVEGKDSFVHNIKLKRDISIASEVDVANAYMKVNGVDKVDAGHFTRFMQDLVVRDKELNKQFISELKKKGFDGIVDYNDSRAGFAQAPLFLFNPSEIIESSKAHKLSSIERFINVMTY